MAYAREGPIAERDVGQVRTESGGPNYEGHMTLDPVGKADLIPTPLGAKSIWG